MRPKMCTASTWMPDQCGLENVESSVEDSASTDSSPTTPTSTPASTPASTPESTPASKRPRIEAVASYVPDGSEHIGR